MYNKLPVYKLGEVTFTNQNKVFTKEVEQFFETYQVTTAMSTCTLEIIETKRKNHTKIIHFVKPGSWEVLWPNGKYTGLWIEHLGGGGGGIP